MRWSFFVLFQIEVICIVLKRRIYKLAFEDFILSNCFFVAIILLRGYFCKIMCYGVKYNYFHMEQRPRFKPDPFKAENFYYNEEQDFCICPMGQKMQRIGTRHVKTASGYVSENARYRAIRCEGCPLRCRCFKAKGNRTIELNHRLRKYKQKAKELLCSEEGLKHRGQRCIEPEAVFGQMKNNMNYKRFRHFGKDKVFMDFAFFAIAFNIKKMCAKITKEGMDWLIRPFYELTVVLFRCCKRINQRNPQNIAA